MLFWILAAAMTAGVLALIMTPLLKQRTVDATRDAYDLEVYRDQLEELDRDLARGVINQAQTAAAKAEIARRMLAASDAGAGLPAAAGTEEGRAPGGAPPRGTAAVAALLAVAIPLGALAVYLPLGSPEEPARPLASRDLERERNAPPENVATAMENLRRQLEDNPRDLQGWIILGQAYGKMGHFQAAAEALGKAAALAPDDTDLLGSYAEALTGANGGTVTDEARRLYDRALEKNSADPRARFYAGLARFQAGELQDALDRWRRLMSESPADAPWVPVLSDYIRQAAEGLGRDPEGAVPQPLPPAAGNQAPSDPSPAVSPSMPPAAGAGTPADRERMIRDMVAGLAARLEADPSDVEGWLRLVRSYSVLGEVTKAAEAAGHAKEQAPDRPDVLVAYATSLLARDARAAAGQAPAAGQPPGSAPAMPGEAVAALRRALERDPANREALWLLGLDAAGTGRRDEAAALWNRLLAQFKPEDPEHAVIRARVDQLKAGG